MGIEINYRFLGDATVEEVRRLKAAPLNILAQTVKTAKQKKTWLEQDFDCQFAESLIPLSQHFYIVKLCSPASFTVSRLLDIIMRKKRTGGRCSKTQYAILQTCMSLF